MIIDVNAIDGIYYVESVSHAIFSSDWIFMVEACDGGMSKILTYLKFHVFM